MHLPSIALALVLTSPAFAGGLDPGETVLVSQNDAGACAAQDSFAGALAGNGRFVAFQSAADNLVPGDANGKYDVFVRDLAKGTIELVSRGAGGLSGNGASSSPSLSKNGRFVAFLSAASDLVPGDGNGKSDVFVADRKTGAIARVSVSTAGVEADNTSFTPVISADGRIVAFQSTASNLVAGDLNAKPDVFVHDRKTHATDRVTINGFGQESNGNSATPALSADGRYVAFWTAATNLDGSASAGVFVRDRKHGTFARVSLTSTGQPVGLPYPDVCSISANGRLVTFAAAGTGVTADDVGPAWDVFVRDVKKASTSLISVGLAGAGADDDCLDHEISGNGRFVVFTSGATNLVAGEVGSSEDVFVRDRKAGTTARITACGANESAATAGVSHDGAKIAFETNDKGAVATPITGWQTFARRM